MLAFFCHLLYYKQATWPVGQAVKTPPSHGGNSGSIPLRAIDDPESIQIPDFSFICRIKKTHRF